MRIWGNIISFQYVVESYAVRAYHLTCASYFQLFGVHGRIRLGFTPRGFISGFLQVSLTPKIETVVVRES